MLNVAVDKTSRKAQKSQKKIRKLIGMMVVRQRGAEIGILSYGMMVVRQRGAEIGILGY